MDAKVVNFLKIQKLFPWWSWTPKSKKTFVKKISPYKTCIFREIHPFIIYIFKLPGARVCTHMTDIKEPSIVCFFFFFRATTWAGSLAGTVATLWRYARILLCKTSVFLWCNGTLATSIYSSEVRVCARESIHIPKLN